MKQQTIFFALGAYLIVALAQADDIRVYQQGEVPDPNDIAAMLGAVPNKPKLRSIVFESAVDNKTINQASTAAEKKTSAFSLPIQFGYDSAALSRDTLPLLNAVAAGIKQVPGVKLLIEGHTDAAGSSNYNKKLSMRRADAVKNYMIKQQGLNADSFQVVGVGESRPLDANDPYADKNRRVEFRLVR